ncbi:hypothetical protein M1C59_02750 [Gordonia terrae]|uniref:hypothetical protein n=1 Tax=Gordonia terrae TaxID=2055 RepID=UPI00200B102B|nr:hypothetical protein [Gordonia terrae]UPW09793.1 hypothetical protein M1C59_02750 [Gordonia terrae]
MSETNTQGPAGSGPDDASNVDGQGSQTTSGSGGKYREKLAAAETERDQLRGVVDGLRKQLVEGHLDGLSPTAFWLAQGDGGVDALLAEDGTVDAEKVAAAVAQTRTTLGIPEGPRSPAPNRLQGQNHDGVKVNDDSDFVDAFGPPQG